uniref:Uncharacterized protein TCIL3000_11_10240 n=1 Tax=Trypanosoma congolense (strain IL3000) TaxID=1068625 RepID=G0V1N1_TRYCI|nr:unnamed protein product [Trypanosoma congolense IL3000]
MSSLYQQKITISAGEECTLCGNCTVELQLLSGVVEVAGVLLNAKEPCTFRIARDQYYIIMYTLEGGCVVVTSDAQVEVSKAVTGMTSVVQLCRRSLDTTPRSKVLVIGHRHSGKTLVAHTICNLLREEAFSVEREMFPTSVFLMDLNAESNFVYAPGCVSTVLVEHVLWPHTSASPTLLPFSLFVGQAAPPGAESVASFLWFVEQLHDCTQALLDSTKTERIHLIIDAPSPPEGIKEGIYFRRLVELLQPSHVVMVSDPNGSDAWSNALHEDLERLHPGCEVSYAPPVAKRCRSSLCNQRLREYFGGKPQAPLGCAKAALPLTQLQFVQYVMTEGEVSCRKVVPSAELAGCICALSHAEVIEEVPLAPILGLLVLLSVDEEEDEVIVIVPTSEALPHRFLIIPSEEFVSSPHCALRSLEAVAHAEEAVAI